MAAGISPNDLQHRVKKMEQFFESGHRVTVTLRWTRKHGRKELKETLDRICEMAVGIESLAFVEGTFAQSSNGRAQVTLVPHTAGKPTPKTTEAIVKLQKSVEAFLVAFDDREAQIHHMRFNNPANIAAGGKRSRQNVQNNREGGSTSPGVTPLSGNVQSDDSDSDSGNSSDEDLDEDDLL